jgi:hypothetical protein
MYDTRRRFLKLLAAGGAMAVAGAPRVRAQAKTQSRPQLPDPTQNADETSGPLAGKSATKLMLEENEKDIKKNIEKLYQLASDLKSEVEKTDSSQVLSLALVKKAEEIEKLAHDIKTRAKG